MPITEKKLASLFIQYAEAKEKAQALEEKIKAAVLEVGESRKIAGITATYYSESTKVDYEAACQDALSKELIDEDAIDRHSTRTVSVKWAEVAKENKLDVTAYGTPVAARVVVK